MDEAGIGSFEKETFDLVLFQIFELAHLTYHGQRCAVLNDFPQNTSGHNIYTQIFSHALHVLSSFVHIYVYDYFRLVDRPRAHCSLIHHWILDL